MPDQLLYIDLETSEKTRNILDVGALLNGRELHEKSTKTLVDWIKQAEFICGHNIIAHDVPIIQEKMDPDLFKDKIIIDTLLWSPILFANRPYHKLVKGYKIVNEEECSNPLSDCKLTRKLLLEELESFEQKEVSFKQCIYQLLKDDPRYNGFFRLVDLSFMDPVSSKDPFGFISKKICDSVDLKLWANESPVSLTYAISILDAMDEDSICSSWVLHQEPKAQEILEEIRFRNCGNENCSHCSKKLDPVKALQEYFGFDNFRFFDDDKGEISLQERTVRAGLQNTSFVAVFPTGGGKSLTFQLPALMRGSLTRQLTVVISPLQSLMKDQVDALEARFNIVKAVAINGLLSPLERQQAIEQVGDGSAHLLYISPESLRSPTILRLLKNRSIARFVIDEAHCFSSWGQDFRVDYLYIGQFIKQLIEDKGRRNKIPVSCFTATAKPQVIEDIKRYFLERLDIELAEFVTRSQRKNLWYEVISIEDKDEKPNALISLLKECEKPAIVYSSRTKKVEELSEKINKTELSSTIFHGQLDKDVKVTNQNSFMNGTIDIIVATSAFGMGIDKDDVRTVIHYDISDSLENYVQEAGRAGRKKEIDAKCYILYHEEDLNKHFSLIQTSKINLKEIQQIWKSIKYLTRFREQISNSALEIAQKAGWETEMRDLENKVKASLSALEDQGFLERKQNSTRVFATSLIIRNVNHAIKKVNEASSISEKQKQNCTRVIQRLIKDDECRLDYLADMLDLKIKVVQETITTLKELGILDDKRDLTAFLDIRKTKNSSRQILDKFLKIEKALIDVLNEKKTRTSIRQLNQAIIEKGIDNSTTDALFSLLNFWDRRKFISKTRTDRQNQIYEIVIKDKDALVKDVEIRHDIAASCFQSLERKLKEQSGVSRNEEVPVEFSVIDLQKELGPFLKYPDSNIKQFEQALLFLNEIKAIKLEGGFMVLYNRLNISNVDKTKVKFTQSDYEKLKIHYEHRVQQVHIVGEYAKKQINDYTEALTYVDDYFKLPFPKFKEKYFPRRGTEIGRPITDSKFREIVGDLDTDQLKIVNSKEDKILVLAGPGSGKTRILVHKIASLIMLEDIKPEQFLMLTFSKAASLEFRSRVFDLIPEYGNFLKISTFHGYCFDLLGQLGDLEKSKDIINNCIQAIESEDIDISSITNKSVLLLDEFQDLTEPEWRLIQTIIKKADNIRVIAVGDDDQNIYEFRGASSKHMKEYMEHYGPAEFYLLKNYRSRQGIIDFNNLLLEGIRNRLKNVPLMVPKKTNQAKIKIVEYNSAYIISPLIEDIISSSLVGTTAVLTKTNLEALLAATLLQERGVKTKLVAGMDWFRLSDLFEMREFRSCLTGRLNGLGIIPKNTWDEARAIFELNYKESPHYQTCSEVIANFEKQFDSTYELCEWDDYIRQIKAENVLNPTEEKIIITTMHKSKSKEFDNVFLMLKDLEYVKDADLRLLYVASSRAKNKLTIHVNNPYFKSFEAPGLTYSVNDKPTAPPEKFDLILNHKHINLGSQKFSKYTIEKLKNRDGLKRDTVTFPTGDALGLAANEHGGNILLFSKHFNTETNSKFEKEGYSFQDASVEYVVYWYDKEEDQEYRVVLPRLRYALNTENSAQN